MPIPTSSHYLRRKVLIVDRALELLTDNPALLLRELRPSDASAYYAVLDRNRVHLTQFGNYRAEGRATAAWVRRSLARRSVGLRFGLWYSGELVGRIELARWARQRFTLAYWLDREHVGHGLMTQALSRLMQHGRESFGASAFFAGVTHGNARSAALLRGLGYSVAVYHSDHSVFMRAA
ncbi:MAG: GNAT family protein [Polyangiaceae bacterium]